MAEDLIVIRRALERIRARTSWFVIQMLCCGCSIALFSCNIINMPFISESSAISFVERTSEWPRTRFSASAPATCTRECAVTAWATASLFNYSTTHPVCVCSGIVIICAQLFSSRLRCAIIACGQRSHIHPTRLERKARTTVPCISNVYFMVVWKRKVRLWQCALRLAKIQLVQ